MQSRRDRETSQCPIKDVAIRRFAQQTTLQDALGQFLDKQRHAVGAVGNLGDHLVGQRLPAGALLGQYGAVVPVEAIERQCADLLLPSPGRLELGAERHDQQYRQGADALDHQFEQLARGRVEPMSVLENHYDRLPAGQTLELPDQRLQCPLFLPLRTEARQWTLSRSRQRGEISKQSHILLRRPGECEYGLELLPLSSGQIVTGESCRVRELLDKREKRAVLVIRRTEIAQAEVRL